MPGSFPNLSNIYPELETTLKNRGGNNNPWNDKVNPGVSGLSTWMRLLSGVDKGCILESINPKAKNFTSVYGSIGGDYIGPGIIGRDFNGAKIQVPSGTSRALRPSPIITSMTVDEKAEGATKLATIKIKAFTKEQCDILAGFFLEPGFHCLCEWGWNTQKSNSQKVGNGDIVTPCDLVAYDQWSTIKDKRLNSDFTYDAFLGIVTGGGISFGDGETYELEIKLTAIGVAAEYMQTHRTPNPTKVGSNAELAKTGLTFEPKKIDSAIKDKKIGQGLFMQMFNQLPAQKRTPDVKLLKNHSQWTDSANFVNMDNLVAYIVNDALQDAIDVPDGSKDESDKTKGKAILLPPMVDYRFIRFELACEIMNAFPLLLDSKQSDECTKYATRNKIINIKDTTITGFPHMFSTDPTKLFIPNPTTPNFKLKDSLKGETLIESYIVYEALDNKENFANIHPQAELTEKEYTSWLKYVDSRLDPSTGDSSRLVPYAFPNTRDLNVKHPADPTFIAVQEKARFWGYLKDLYINFDFFIECISKPNYVIRDVYYEMLNGMSSACNSIWKFQIQEDPKQNPEGKFELKVVDLNFLGNVKEIDNEGARKIAVFQARGVKSPFISCDFSVEVQAAMMSSVIVNKLKDDKGKSYDNSPEVNPRPMLGTVFSTLKEDKVGTILNAIAKKAEEVEDKDKDEDKSNSAPQQPAYINPGQFGGHVNINVATTPEEKKAVADRAAEKAKKDKIAEQKASNYEYFTNTASVYPKSQDRTQPTDLAHGKLDWYSGNDVNLDTFVQVGTWNDPTALRQCFLIDKGLVQVGNQPIETFQKKKDSNTQNPPFGVAEFDFKVHGVSGFKVGDKFQIEGLPDKFGSPNFYQVVKVDHTIDGMLWTTDIKSKLRMVGTEK